MSPRISLAAALGWIIGSAFLTLGIGHKAIQWHVARNAAKMRSSQYFITTIFQTGPQREALRSACLAELLGIAIDKPVHFYRFSCNEAKKKICACPLIKEVSLKTLEPDALYIDYSVRQPIAWVYEYPNVAIDEEKYLFPITPFLSPKNLPEIYLGLAPFGKPSENPELPIAEWNKPLQGKHITLALTLLALLSEPSYRDFFTIKRIDVSKAYTESCGSREIVIWTEDTVEIQGKRVIFPRYLRLGVKNYAQGLGNYLKLREKLLEKESNTLDLSKESAPLQIIDLRLSDLGYISN